MHSQRQAASGPKTSFLTKEAWPGHKVTTHSLRCPFWEEHSFVLWTVTQATSSVYRTVRYVWVTGRKKSASKIYGSSNSQVREVRTSHTSMSHTGHRTGQHITALQGLASGSHSDAVLRDLNQLLFRRKLSSSQRTTNTKTSFALHVVY